MELREETIDQMAAEKSVARKRVMEAILAILTLADGYRNSDGNFSFASHPELDDEVNRILIDLSDGLLKDAEDRARTILEQLGLEADEESILQDAEDGDEGLLWALDMHSSNLKRLVEGWIIIMFARDLTVNQALARTLAYIDAPDASPMWREAVRARLIDPNEVKFGRGYQRKIADAFSVTLQTFINTAFLKGTILKGRRDGAIGYRTFRQSNYDCELCDSLTKRIWPIDEMVLPAHPRCVCGIEFVYDV